MRCTSRKSGGSGRKAVETSAQRGEYDRWTSCGQEGVSRGRHQGRVVDGDDTTRRPAAARRRDRQTIDADAAGGPVTHQSGRTAAVATHRAGCKTAAATRSSRGAIGGGDDAACRCNRRSGRTSAGSLEDVRLQGWCSEGEGSGLQTSSGAQYDDSTLVRCNEEVRNWCATNHHNT